jgi:hypothetical protein
MVSGLGNEYNSRQLKRFQYRTDAEVHACCGFLAYSDSQLVVSSKRQATPRRLPPNFDDIVEVFELVDTDFPGYVLLKRIGLMIKRLTGDEYVFMSSSSSYRFYAKQPATSQLGNAKR